jgi:hypothetical protein
VTTDRVWIGEWIYDHLHTSLKTTSNYSAIVDLHTSQTTTAPAMPFLACSVSNSHSLGMASNSGVSSASRAHVITVQRISRNWTLPLTNQILHSTPLNWTGQKSKSKSKSESKLLYDWRFTANQFVLASSPLRLTTSDFFFNWTFVVVVLMQHPLWTEHGFVSHE